MYIDSEIMHQEVLSSCPPICWQRYVNKLNMVYAMQSYTYSADIVTSTQSAMTAFMSAYRYNRINIIYT